MGRFMLSSPAVGIPKGYMSGLIKKNSRNFLTVVNSRQVKYLCGTLFIVKCYIKKLLLLVETVNSLPLPFQSMNDIQRGDCLAFSMLCIFNSISEEVFEKLL